MEIDRKEFESLCRMQYTPERTAVFFGCSQAALRRWIRAEYGRPPKEVVGMLAERGRARLLQMQFQLAAKNAAMAVRLGELYLRQDAQTGLSDDQLRALEGMVLDDA